MNNGQARKSYHEMLELVRKQRRQRRFDVGITWAFTLGAVIILLLGALK